MAAKFPAEGNLPYFDVSEASRTVSWNNEWGKTSIQSVEACLTIEIAAEEIIYIQTISISRNVERFAS